MGVTEDTADGLRGTLSKHTWPSAGCRASQAVHGFGDSQPSSPITNKATFSPLRFVFQFYPIDGPTCTSVKMSLSKRATLLILTCGLTPLKNRIELRQKIRETRPFISIILVILIIQFELVYYLFSLKILIPLHIGM